MLLLMKMFFVIEFQIMFFNMIPLSLIYNLKNCFIILQHV